MTAPSAIPTHVREDATLRAAFRDLHGPRLHGFALLVSLGDRRRAAAAAAGALADGEARASELRHPERAAAWLRERVLRRLRRQQGKLPEITDRRAAFEEMGASPLVFDGLSSLGFADRAAIVAATVEGFEGHDLEYILHASPAATRRQVVLARTRYLAAVARQPGAAAVSADRISSPNLGSGELQNRIGGIARRTLGDDDGSSQHGAAG